MDIQKWFAVNKDRKVNTCAREWGVKTLALIKAGRVQNPSYETALRIVAGTDGAVSLHELCGNGQPIPTRDSLAREYQIRCNAEARAKSEADAAVHRSRGTAAPPPAPAPATAAPAPAPAAKARAARKPRALNTNATPAPAAPARRGRPRKVQVA
jgi:pyruvate/2-oxoglutarate dehydrogenase complex dihydrolipoamide acyltransferase (E2) component